MPHPHNELATDLIRSVELLAAVFAAHGTRYAVVGGIAAGLRGRTRFTQDVDILLDVPQLALPSLLDTLVENGFGLDVPTVIQQYVRQHITAFRYREIRIDWLKPVLPLYRRALNDATFVEWENQQLRVATAEGIILTKMVAFRPQDLLDIEALIAANQAKINLDIIRTEWAAVAVGEEDRTAWLGNAIARLVPQHQTGE